MATLLTYVLRLTLNHRAVYCYMVLSAWLLILLGMYKYVTNERGTSGVLRSSSSNEKNRHVLYKPEIKIKRVSSFCNPHYSIYPGAEGLVNRNYSLEGVLLLMRHGDRGPLTHIRNISNINCAGGADPLYSEYEEYIGNITGSVALTQLLGAFHGFPALPGVDCSLGQLTRYGALQLLRTGRVLSEAYSDPLGINNSTFLKKDIIAYSTRYRRTLQSALAFLFAFLSRENLAKVSLQEVQSLAFCFDDCACPAADRYFNLFLSKMHRLGKGHPSLRSVLNSMASIVYQIPDWKISGDPHSLKDALLTYICHGAQLPCLDKFPAPQSCVTTDQVLSLFSYLEWEGKQYSKNKNLRYGSLLRAYGLMRNIVSQLLRLVSERRPKVVLYSGHDKTISYITTALGIFLHATSSPTYASRLIFEVYRSRSDSIPSNEGPMGSDYFFRLLFNGRDITDNIIFCKPPNGLLSVSNSRQGDSKIPHNGYLCPIESIIRFLHEDYFSSFNSTNMKDACAL